ncbi:MAG: UTP--glucose-1-phosphate uridylyltransferase GalU [Candidatus Babeliales bacterium]
MERIKAIIPAAGLGSRFLPYTKAVPKEMLPLLNKPAIQYIVEEGISSDIHDFIIVTSREKQAIVNHFDPSVELELLLQERGKLDLLDTLKKITRVAHFTYVRQSEPRGLGHAVWTARRSFGKEYFGIFLPDDIIISKQAAMAQLMKVARQEKASVIAVQEVPMGQVSSYGIIGIKKQITPNLFQVSNLVEKPDQKNAPSNLAVIGRYVLSSKIFAALEEIEADHNEELQLTDAICQMIHNNEKVFAVKVQGIRYDIGNPIGWIKANIGCALQDPQMAPHINKFLQDKDLLDTFLYSPSKIFENQL